MQPSRSTSIDSGTVDGFVGSSDSKNFHEEVVEDNKEGIIPTTN